MPKGDVFINEMLISSELVEQAQEGDESAFNQIVSTYRRRILGTVGRLIRRSEDVEDVVQDIFLKLYFSLQDLNSSEFIEPWLHRLTVNATYDYLRKERRRREERMSDLSEEKALIIDIEAARRASSQERQSRQVKDLVHTLLQSVSPKDRILLILKEIEGLSMNDLTKVYSVKESALKVRLFRARRRVLKAYDRHMAKVATPKHFPL